MDTPFTPKTHISKRIKIWAVILLVAVILASGLAMLTGGKTRLFRGSMPGLFLPKMQQLDLAITPTLKLTATPESPQLINTPITFTIELIDINNVSGLHIDFGDDETDYKDNNINKTSTFSHTYSAKGDYIVKTWATAEDPLNPGTIITTAETQSIYKITDTTITVNFPDNKSPPSLSTIKPGEEKEIMKFTLNSDQPIAFEKINFTQKGTADLNKDIEKISAFLDTVNGVHVDLETSIDANTISLTTPAKLFMFDKINMPATLTVKATIDPKAEIEKTIKLAIPEKGGIVGLTDITPTGLPIETSLFTIIGKTEGSQEQQTEGTEKEETDAMTADEILKQQVQSGEGAEQAEDQAYKAALAAKNAGDQAKILSNQAQGKTDINELNTLKTQAENFLKTAQDKKEIIEGVKKYLPDDPIVVDAYAIADEAVKNADEAVKSISALIANLKTPPAPTDITPKLTLSIPADAPKDGNVEQGKTIETTAFELKAENNPIIITKLRLTHLSPNDISTTADITSISIKSSVLPPITVSPDSKFPYYYIVLPTNWTIPADTSIKFWIQAKVKATAPVNNQFKLGFLEKESITAFAVDTSTPVEIIMQPLDQNFKTFGGTFTIVAAGLPDTPAGAQLTVSKPTEIAAGNIAQGASADVLKLKFQASADSDITVNSVKITIQGPTPATDLQFIKLIEGQNTIIGSSTDPAIFTPILPDGSVYGIIINTPGLIITKNTPREFSVNIGAKATAVKDHAYLFRIAANTDISALPQNVFLEPGNELLSSNEFKITAAQLALAPAPTVSVTASPANSQVSGQIITFTMTVNNGPGGLYNYTLDLGDSKTVKTQASTAASTTFDHVYSETKTYTVKGSVTMVVNNAAATISAPNLDYTITAPAAAAPPPAPSQDIINMQNQIALLQQQLAAASSSQSSQSTAQIQTLTQQIAQLAALAAAAKEESAKSKSDKEPAKKSKTPIETLEMWGAGPAAPAPVPSAPAYIPPFATQPVAPAYLAQVPTGAQLYAAAPSLGYSQKLVKAPEKSNTGPEVLVYFIAVGAANAAWWIRRKIRK